MSSIRLNTGEIYRVSASDANGEFQFRERLRSGRLVFISQSTGAAKRLDEDEFEELRLSGKAVRLRFRQPGDKNAVEHLPPEALMDPSDKKLTPKERHAARKALKNTERARTVLFYLTKWDERPDVGDSRIPVERMVREHRNEALEEGLEWLPSYSTLKRALPIGRPGDRSLLALLRQAGAHDETRRYPPFVLRFKKEAIDDFWRPNVDQKDAIFTFLDKFDKEAARLNEAGLTPPKRPDSSTVRKWILGARTYERHALKFGEPDADRFYKGSRPSIQAEYALQYVMIDHTRCDHWAIILDEEGTEIFRERPWIVAGVDVFSEMVVAFMLTIEPPSLVTVTACLKQMLRRKDFLTKLYGDHKGSTSGPGAPDTVIVDNAWENTGKSFQTGCESVGIAVKWAPVRTGEYKTFVEHLFHKLNKEIWHKSKGGIPHKPHVMTQLRLDPRSETDKTIEQLEAEGWDYIVTLHHLDNCERRHMPRAKAWTTSINKVGRNLLDDMTALDRALGRVRECTLTRNGVNLDGHRFHDHVGTSQLLDSLARHALPSQQSKSPLSSAKVRVQAVEDPTDCSYVNIWDFARKAYVRLPNVDARFSSGCDWRTATLIKKFADAENLAFHSDEEKVAARAAFRERRESDVKSKSFREARRALRPQQSLMRRVPGDIVEVYAEPTVAGMAPTDIPTGLAAANQLGRRLPPKGNRRGRPSKKKAEQGTSAAPPPSKITVEARAIHRDTNRVFVIADSQAFLDEIAKDLD